MSVALILNLKNCIYIANYEVQVFCTQNLFLRYSLEGIFISIFSSEFNVCQLTGNFLAETFYFFTLL